MGHLSLKSLNHLFIPKNVAFGIIIASVLNTSIDTLAFFDKTNKVICADSDQTSLLVSTELLICALWTGKKFVSYSNWVDIQADSSLAKIHSLLCQFCHYEAYITLIVL